MSHSLRAILESPSGLVGGLLTVFVLAVALLGPQVLTTDPLAPDLGAKLKPPGPGHWFGTDELGRDVLSRVVFGARTSLTITVLGVVGSLVAGSLLGLLAGFRRGAWEMVIMHAIDMLLAMPGFLLALLAIAVLGIGVQNLIGSLAIQSLPVFARVAHAATLSVRETEFIQAAQAIGATERRIMLREVVPNIVSPLLVQATLRLATTLLLASSLSFLGLGVQPPEPEWGAMLSGGRAYVTAAPHVIFFPGLAIMLTTLGFNLMGDALRDTLDPRYRKE
ncbi:MAG TPA: ABC transporter permease [Candidatus Methylomirabilis sp.]|nr:ABC transporter permease [Candidatus Methylomirabilis sp.]